jgi:exodeoxyribonuclease VII small subunit
LTGRVEFSYFRVLKGFFPIMPKSPKPGSAGGESLSFEAALAELEKLVAAMESGQLSLEQSLAAHKRGLELAQYCQAKLAQAQQQVQILEANTLQAFPGAEQDN